MKKRFTRILAALALLVFMTPSMVAWGQNVVTFTPGTDVGETSVTKDGVTATMTTMNNASYYQIYANASGTFTVTNDEDRITKIEFTCTASGTSKYGPGNASANVGNYTYSEYTGTWTGEASSIVISSTAQVRMTSLTITHNISSGGTTTYTVTYNCNGGTSGCPENVTDIEAGTSITLASAPTKADYIFNGWNDGTETYQAGASYTVNGNVTMTAQWELDGDYLFYESFDDCNGTGGNDGQWSGSIATNNINPDNEDWTFANGNGANKCAKFGTGSKLGSAQTPSISHTGNVTLTFKAAAWNTSSEHTTLKLSATSGTLSAATVTLLKGAWNNYTINITGITTSTQIKFEGEVASNSRFFLDEVMVVEAATSTVATPVIIPASGTEFGNDGIDVTITCETENSTIYYTLDGSTPDNQSTLYSDVIHLTETKTVNAIAYVGNDASNVATATYTYVDPNAPGTENNPYTVADLDASNLPSGNVYVSGIVSRFYAANIMSDGSNYRYYISDDGTTESTEVRVFRGNGLNNVSFSNVNDLLVGDHVVICGSLGIYQNEIQFSAGNYIVSLERPQSTDPSVTVTPDDISVDCGEHTGTLNMQALNLENYSYGITYFEADGETTTMYSWINVTFNGNGTATYNIDANTGAAQFAYFKVRANDLSGNLICYSNLVTVYQAAYEAPFEGGTYMKASGIESGKTYIIVGGEDEDYAMGADRGNNRGAVSVVSDGLTITVEPGQAVYEFVIASIDDLEGYYTIYDPRNNGYLYAAGGTNNNYLKTGAYANEDEEGQWAINIDSENSIATIVANFGNEKANTQPRNTMRFNSGNNPPVFSCYGSENTMKDIYLYEKVATLTINGYTDVTEGNNNKGYYLIASPVTVDLTNHDMTTGDFDLYYFDQTGGGEDGDGKEWRNYEDTPFDLVPGTGYLYAKKANYEGEVYSFNLVGDPYTGDGTIELTYTEGEGIDFPGLNLVGNPFTNETTFTIYDYETGEFPELNFLTMNNTGDGFITTTTNSFTAAVMQGFFVQATGYSLQLQVGEVGGLKTANLNIQVSRNRGNVIDNAIVNFGNASMMDKYYLSNNTTRVYIPQNNREMAVVRSAAEAEMPVSFRASENGTYTLAVEAENVEMNYLHLIDNLTGMDVDLLQTPSYTFEAKTSDYASRFRLVFKANGTNENNAETFAYFNGTNWTVSNVGEATLQVVDVTGRTVANQMINGNAELNLNQPAGVYVIRLVNGDNVKTQKVVVR